MIGKIVNTPEFIMTVKFIIALICGGMLGLEREQKGRAAGFRTYMLVCVGSALVMVINQHLGEIYPGIDPSRMGAQVISGIGFLGVGTIIVTGGNRVRGLTTAAGLWATACIGLAIGAGNYYAAIMVSVLIYITMRFLQSMDKKVGARAKVLNAYVEFEDVTDVGKFVRELKKEDFKIVDMEMERSNKKIELYTAVLFSLSLPHRENHNKIMERFNKMDGVVYAEEI